MKQSTSQKTSKSPVNWKVVIYLFIFITALCLFGFYPPAKLALFQLASLLQNHSWYGPVVIVSIIGLIVVPVGLPHSVFEMVLAFLISPYLFAVGMSLTAKMLGCTVCYVITKKKLKDKIRAQFQEKKISIGIQKLLEKQPFRFLVIIWAIAIPMSFKTYGLSMMDNVKYRTYILSALLGSLPASLMEIHIYQQAGSISELFNKKSASQNIFSTIMLLVSFTLIIYLMCYTKKIMKQLEDHSKYVPQENDIEIQKIDLENNTASMQALETEKRSIVIPVENELQTIEE
jgi:uncharacterized membrane protein YdjX (TVP38/TMEM64 family)